MPHNVYIYAQPNQSLIILPYLITTPNKLTAYSPDQNKYTYEYTN